MSYVRSSWLLLSSVVFALMGCAASTQPIAQSTTNVSVSPTPVHVDQQVHVRVDNSATAGASALLAGTQTCPGLTIHPAGGTRSGRALGMALLAVHARPGAELLVDGAFQGRTPLTAVGVDAGPRDVTLRNTTIGYECTVRIRAVPGERYAFQLDLDGLRRE
jgi:hypothetical protein